jgi:hypothetical protein
VALFDFPALYAFAAHGTASAHQRSFPAPAMSTMFDIYGFETGNADAEWRRRAPVGHLLSSACNKLKAGPEIARNRRLNSASPSLGEGMPLRLSAFRFPSHIDQTF